MAKKKKAFLPKKIAGVKVPKKVRQGRFGELLASPTGQKVIAEAIMAAGAALGAKKAADHPKVRQLAQAAKDKGAAAAAGAGDKAAGVTAQAGTTSGAIAYALGEAARTFTEALRRGGAAEPRSFSQGEQTAAYAGFAPDQSGEGASEKQSTAPSVPPL
jgi:hypothetical protein